MAIRQICLYKYTNRIYIIQILVRWSGRLRHKSDLLRVAFLRIKGLALAVAARQYFAVSILLRNLEKQMDNTSVSKLPGIIHSLFRPMVVCSPCHCSRSSERSSSPVVLIGKWLIYFEGRFLRIKGLGKAKPCEYYIYNPPKPSFEKENLWQVFHLLTLRELLIRGRETYFTPISYI